MILPLPVMAIDTLVAVNISIGFGLLLLAIYIPTPVAFSSFPSVLRLTTLFRLALSIAITRSKVTEVLTITNPAKVAVAETASSLGSLASVTATNTGYTRRAQV